MKNEEVGKTMAFDQSMKKHHRKPKSREVSSRFLLSPNNDNSPLLRQKLRSSTDTRKPKTIENSGSNRGLWPSSGSSNSIQTPSSMLNKGTLADHLGNERLIDLAAHDKNRENSSNPMFLNRQRSCTAEFGRFENDQKETINSKENHKPLFGKSMRYAGKFRFSRKSSASSSSSKSPKCDEYNDNNNHNIIPGRFSVDEIAIRKRDTRRKSDYLSDLSVESESGTSYGSPMIGKNSAALSYMAPTVSSRMSGIEVPSKYMQDLSSRSQRWSADSSPLHKQIIASSPDNNSPNRSPFTLKSAIKRANSGIETSKIGLSPGRSSSGPSSNYKPPTSPSRTKVVGNFLAMGLELLKGKKSTSNGTWPLGPSTGENVHQLRMLHNTLVQWRYANAKAEIVNANINKQVERNLIYGWDAITKLQHSVKQKKVLLEKEKLEMKFNYILHSQIKSLEAWGDLERQHLSSVNMTKDCLHSVVCRVPLIEGAKAEPESASLALRNASEVTAALKSMLSNFRPVADKTAEAFAELAEIVTQEKLLLEECLELFKFISELEVQERSLKCNIVQLKYII